MKHKKRVTDAVLVANRANAKRSTGPRSDEGKENSCRNSLRHGILARKVELDSHEERQEYRMIKLAWRQQYRPKGTLERFLVDQIALISWKLGIVEALEVEELSRRQDTRNGVDSIFHGELELPLNTWDLPLDQGWDCERMIVRAVAEDDRGDSSQTKSPAIIGGQVVRSVQNGTHHHGRKVGHLEVEAVLGSSINTFNRYRTGLNRDLHQAIGTLSNIQKERREREEEFEPSSDKEGAE